MKAIKVIIFFVIGLQSCNQKANLSFWAAENSNCETYSIHIDNNYLGEVNSFYNSNPGCNNKDLLHIELKPGTYEISSNNGCNVINKQITLSKKECYLFRVD